MIAITLLLLGVPVVGALSRSDNLLARWYVNSSAPHGLRSVCLGKAKVLSADFRRSVGEVIHRGVPLLYCLGPNPSTDRPEQFGHLAQRPGSVGAVSQDARKIGKI